MRPIVIDRVAYGLSVTIVSRVKTAGPIEMSFGLRVRVGPKNRVLDGDKMHMRRGIFEGKTGSPL